MNRFKRFHLLILLFIFVVLFAFYSPAIRTFFNAFSVSIEIFYQDGYHAVHELLDDHFRQASEIVTLKKRNKKLEKLFLLQKSDSAAFFALQSALGVKPETNNTLEAVRPLGYAQLGNFQKLWLGGFKDFDPSKIYGVIRNMYAIGIVVESAYRPLMVLAGDKACSFAVYIGKQRAPGIATGFNARTMVVKYIPEWMHLKRGDIVTTSGLDHIFPLGIPVGKVLSTQKMQGFQNAKIELFGDTLHPDFVWVTTPRNASK